MREGGWGLKDVNINQSQLEKINKISRLSSQDSKPNNHTSNKTSINMDYAEFENLKVI